MWEIDLLEKNLPLFKLNIMTISNLSFLGKAMLWVQIISAGFSPFQDDDIPHFLKVFFENLPLHAFYSYYILIFFKIYLLMAFWRFNLYYFLYGNWFQKFWVFIILFFLYSGYLKIPVGSSHSRKNLISVLSQSWTFSKLNLSCQGVTYRWVPML